MRMSEDEDSLQLQIEMPKQQRKRLTTVIPNWQFDFTTNSHNQFRLFLTANAVYIHNVMQRKQQPNIKQSIRSKIDAGALIYHQFNIFIQKADGVREQHIEVKGQIALFYTQYKGFKLGICFSNFQPSYLDYFIARFRKKQMGEHRFRTQQLNKDEKDMWYCQLDDRDAQLYLDKVMAIEVQFERNSQQENRFVGIKNQGNTCYMNAILQILFFVRPLRKSVVDYQGQGKVMLALRDVFLELMNGPIDKTGAVDGEALIQAFGRFADYPRRQQDTQEFLLSFLEELQGECPSLAELWKGQILEALESKQSDKPYKSSQKQDFIGLDLPLEDFKGNTFGQMVNSMHYLLQPQHMEDKIQTDDYGKVSVIKSRQFLQVPLVLFLTLKRYQFKKTQTRATKVMADLQYPKQINLGFLFGTPTGTDMEYDLYAITVHKGQHYNSGHYYSFINTAETVDKPCWVKFNDSQVHLASEEQALNFTGGKKKNVTWNSQFQRFMEREQQGQDTAYILVYFKRQAFNEYQQMDVPIPRKWLDQKRKKKYQQHKMSEVSGDYQVQVLVADFTSTGSLFSNDILTIPIGLEPNKCLVNQLKHYNGSFLGCKVGSVWKVSQQACKVKKLQEFADLPQTPSRVFDPKRGHRRPDYILITPEKTDIFTGGRASKGKEGLVVSSWFDNGIESDFRMIYKEALDDYITQIENRIHKKVSVKFENKQDFLYDWNDFIQLEFQ